MKYLFAAGAALAGLIALIAGWITNVIWTFNQSETVDVLLGILGCIMFPIGALHGIYTWF